jgi:hypothetical protein
MTEKKTEKREKKTSVAVNKSTQTSHVLPPSSNRYLKLPTEQVLSGASLAHFEDFPHVLNLSNKKKQRHSTIY